MRFILIFILFTAFNVKASTVERAWSIYAKAPLIEHVKFKDFLHAYSNHLEIASKPIMAIINYNLPSTQKRLWIINTHTGNILANTYAAHGVNTGGNMAEKFSNKVDSKQTSLGVYLGAETYYGKHGYSLRLDGMSKSNSEARKRAIVIHGAEYAEESHINKNGYLGRSWGCPAVPRSISKRVIDLLKFGSTIHSLARTDSY